jgi:LysM repeat protein
MTKLRNSRDAARKGRLDKTPFGRFMNWLTTPAPLSQILEPLKGPALKKKAASGSKGGPGRPAGTGKQPAAKKSPTKKSGITAPTSKGLYTIKSGDTLSQIAKARGTTIAALKKANNITDVNKIRAGRKLKIPAAAGKSKNPYAGETKSSMAAMIKKTKKSKRPSNAEIAKMSTKELEALAKRIGLPGERKLLSETGAK